MLVISPLSAVTKVMEVCAPLESVLTAKVAGVSDGRAVRRFWSVLSRLMVTPLITAVTWLLALVVAKPLTVKWHPSPAGSGSASMSWDWRDRKPDWTGRRRRPIESP